MLGECKHRLRRVSGWRWRHPGGGAPRHHHHPRTLTTFLVHDSIVVRIYCKQVGSNSAGSDYGV